MTQMSTPISGKRAHEAAEPEGVLDQLAATLLGAAGATSPPEEGALHASVDHEARYQAIVEQIPAVIFMAYLDRPVSQAFISPHIEKALGFSREEWLGDPVLWFRQIHPDDRERWNAEAAQMLLSGRPLHSAYRMTARDGRVVWLQCEALMVRRPDGLPWFIHGVAFDVTDLKEAEEAVAKQATLLELANDAIFVREMNGRVTYWNHGAEMMYGWSKLDAIGRNVRTLLRTEYSTPFEQIEAELSRTGRWEGELIQIARNGRRIVVNSRWALQQDEHGKPYAILEIGTDISRRKHAELELKRRAEELARSNDDLQQFAYVASHDLQEPLRMVSTFLEILDEEYKPQLDDTARQYIDYAVDGARRMRQLISDLLDYSRIGSGDRNAVPTNFESLLNDVRSNLAVTIQETAALITNDPLPVLTVVPSQILILFQNLVGNAIKFRSPSRRPIIHISARRGGAVWHFSVSDNGIGIKPEHRDNLFVIFRRLHHREEYPGTGIGLAVCKKIVERMDGRIWVESEVGEGSTFHFTVPAETNPEGAKFGHASTDALPTI